MARSNQEGEAGLERGLGLMTWWCAPLEGNEGAAPLERMRAFVAEAQAALEAANESQARSLAELGRKVPALLLEAAKARDPQAALGAQLAIAALVQRCGTDCAFAWAEFALRLGPASLAPTLEVASAEPAAPIAEGRKPKTGPSHA